MLTKKNLFNPHHVLDIDLQIPFSTLWVFFFFFHECVFPGEIRILLSPLSPWIVLFYWEILFILVSVLVLVFIHLLTLP